MAARPGTRQLSLLFMLRMAHAVLANGDLFYVGKRNHARPQDEHSIGSARSPDRGRTWESLGSIHGYPPYPGKLSGGLAQLEEPHVVETRSGKLVGMVRYEETKDPDHPAVEAICAGAGRTDSQVVNFSCDASKIAARGIPCVVIGPGDIANAHTSDESIAVAELEEGLATYIRIARTLLAS